MGLLHAGAHARGRNVWECPPWLPLQPACEAAEGPSRPADPGEPQRIEETTGLPGGDQRSAVQRSDMQQQLKRTHTGRICAFCVGVLVHVRLPVCVWEAELSVCVCACGGVSIRTFILTLVSRNFRFGLNQRRVTLEEADWNIRPR